MSKVPELPPFNYGEDGAKGDLRHGFLMPDGSTYVGEWKGFEIHGKGVLESSD